MIIKAVLYLNIHDVSKNSTASPKNYERRRFAKYRTSSPRLALHSSHELTIPICPSDFPFPDYLRAPLPVGSAFAYVPELRIVVPSREAGSTTLKFSRSPSAGGTTASAGAVARARASALSHSHSIDNIFSIQREHVTTDKDDNIIPSEERRVRLHSLRYFLFYSLLV